MYAQAITKFMWVHADGRVTQSGHMIGFMWLFSSSTKL